MSGYDDYRCVDLESRATTASPYQLVLLLYDGLLEELERVRGHIQGRRFELKGRSLEKCLGILDGLDGALDHQEGGELVASLEQLYDYCRRRLCEVSVTLSLDSLDEVVHLLGQLRLGWEAVHASR
ncbi:flagellar export chaperone FliS [Pseudomonas sp. HR96]|uniref:flagellar export chaperone FliS n=1 Tax=Pseudomonas sp. HR96 TaxID=1027966 RepID=UPI002A757E70|nr:flagellar export chaperone FliS [Pseudomonas sp. HR96]WPP00057.1 flagellar export chaperone FliS [Pseudomonas sp. HR96]